MKTLFILTFILLLTSLNSEEKIFFLENSKLKLGISLSAGGGIFHFGQKDGRNLLNFHDRGRFIQQSYYGKKDGSKWGDRNWIWNPVQAGNYKNKGAKIIEFKRSPEVINVKSVPLHWATGELMEDCLMEQWVILKGNIAHIRYKFTYSGKLDHPKKKQELPAVYVDSKYHKLVFYSGDRPWVGAETDSIIPGWPNKTFKITESWAAYIDEEGFGIGIMSPQAKELTAYRYVEKNLPGPLSLDTSYFAPIKKFAIVKDEPLVFDVFLTLGKLNKIRSRFTELHKNMLDE